MLYKPKPFGGVDLRKAAWMNQALLVRLAWRILTKESDFWCKMLRRKYCGNPDDGIIFRDRQRASKTWKGVVWGLDLLRLGAR